MEWIRQLKTASPDLELFPGASPEVIGEAEQMLGQLPAELRELLSYTNGLACRSFRLYSAFDRAQLKKTWESLQRANGPSKTDALGGDQDLLGRFLVFGNIGNGFAAWDRSDGSIWFEESQDSQLQQTDFSFEDFVATMVRNAE
jgi:hypothetical protein